MIDIRKKKNIVYWDNSKRIASYDVNISDILVPAKRKLPKWYGDLEKSHIKRANTCPSFQELFRDSYCYIAPCDMTFEVVGTGKVNFAVPTEGLVYLSTHSHLDDFPTQMGPSWDINKMNIKICPNIVINSPNSSCRVIFLEAFYHNPDNKLIVAPGTLDLAAYGSNGCIDLNLNTFLDTKKNKGAVIEIKAGDVLGLLYFPGGLPKLEHKKLKQSPMRKFLGNYNWLLKERKNSIKNENKCPFGFKK